MKKIYLLSVLGLLTALAPVINNMFSPAMPALAAAYGCEQASVQLGLTAAMLGLALGQLVIGPWSDRSGRRRPLLWSLALLVIASATCALAPNIATFVVLRVVQGLAAGGGIVIARSVATDISRGNELIKTLAFINVFNGLAPIVTPMVGGALTTSMGWQGPMIGMLVVAVVLLVACFWVHESLPVERRVSHDLRTTLLLYKEVFANRPCIHTILHQGAALAVLFGNIAATPFLVTHYGYAPSVIGYALGANGIFTALGAGAAAAMGSGERGMRITSAGLLSASIAMAVALVGDLGFWPYEICISVMLFFVGVTLTSSSGYAMESARNQAGTASALLGAAGFVAGAIVAPLMGLGNMLVSAAVVYVVSAVLTQVFCRLALTSSHPQSPLKG